MYKTSIVPGSIPSIKQNKPSPKSNLYQLDEVCGAQASNSSEASLVYIAGRGQ